MQAIIDDQGRVEIPRELRDRLHLTPGDVVDLKLTDNGLNVTPAANGADTHRGKAKLLRDGTLLLLAGSEPLTLDDAIRALESSRAERIRSSDDESIEPQ